MVGSLQEFIEAAGIAVQKLSPEEKAEFRQAWRDQIANRIRMTENDKRFLHSVGIDPSGD